MSFRIGLSPSSPRHPLSTAANLRPNVRCPVEGPAGKMHGTNSILRAGVVLGHHRKLPRLLLGNSLKTALAGNGSPTSFPSQTRAKTCTSENRVGRPGRSCRAIECGWYAYHPWTKTAPEPG
jgi:hypothetical protein